MSEKRNLNSKMDAPDALSPDPACRGGGSAVDMLFSEGGGGYLETCKDLTGAKKNSADLDREWMSLLAATGINQPLLNVADRMGFQNFVLMWSVLDQDDMVLDDRRRLHVPSLQKTLLRLQRNRLIRELGESGLSAREIIDALPVSLRKDLKRRTVLRILSGK